MKEPTRINRNAKVRTETSFEGRWKSNRDPVLQVKWGDVSAEAIRLAVDTISLAGGAIMLGITSDRGAYSVVVLHGEAKLKEYPHSVQEAEELLAWLTDEFLPRI